MSAWPQAHKDALRQLMSDPCTQWTFSQLARCLNEQFGTTYSRNSVIGAASRNGLRSTSGWKTGISPIQQVRQVAIPARPKRSHHRKPVAIFKPAPILVTCEDVTKLRDAPVEPLNLTLADLQFGQCHWPYGDSPFVFCGHKIFDGYYCLAHHLLSIREYDRRRPTAA